MQNLMGARKRRWGSFKKRIARLHAKRQYKLSKRARSVTGGSVGKPAHGHFPKPSGRGRNYLKRLRRARKWNPHFGLEPDEIK